MQNLVTPATPAGNIPFAVYFHTPRRILRSVVKRGTWMYTWGASQFIHHGDSADLCDGSDALSTRLSSRTTRAAFHIESQVQRPRHDGVRALHTPRNLQKSQADQPRPEQTPPLALHRQRGLGSNPPEGMRFRPRESLASAHLRLLQCKPANRSRNK